MVRVVRIMVRVIRVIRVNVVPVRIGMRVPGVVMLRTRAVLFAFHYRAIGHQVAAVVSSQNASLCRMGILALMSLPQTPKSLYGLAS